MTTWKRGQTDRFAAQGSSPGSIPEPGDQGFAYEGPGKREIDVGADPVMASRRLPQPQESCWVSQRSIPRVGTATTSGVIGSVDRHREQIAEHVDEPVSPLRAVE